MTISPDAVRAFEQELLQKADMLALGLNGLRATAPERATELLDDIVRRLAGAVAGTAPGVVPDERGRAEPRRQAPVVVAARGGGADDIEDFILDILAEIQVGLSVQDMVSNSYEAQ